MDFYVREVSYVKRCSDVTDHVYIRMIPQPQDLFGKGRAAPAPSISQHQRPRGQTRVWYRKSRRLIFGLHGLCGFFSFQAGYHINDLFFKFAQPILRITLASLGMDRNSSLGGENSVAFNQWDAHCLTGKDISRRHFVGLTEIELADFLYCLSLSLLFILKLSRLAFSMKSN